PAAALAVSPDGSTVYAVGTVQEAWDGCIGDAGDFHTAAYDASDGTERWSALYQSWGFDCYNRATSLALTPDGTKLFVAGYGGPEVGGGSSYQGAVLSYDASTG